jgi:hypothetical protein
MSPPQLVLSVLPARGSVYLEPGHRPARGFWPELHSSFRKYGSRPREGSRTPATAPPGSPLASLTLVKIRCSPKLYMRPNCKGVGFPCSRLDSSLSARPCGLSSSAVHRELSPTASFSRELCASSRVLRQAARPLRSASHGVLFPHRGVSSWRPLIARGSHAPSFRSVRDVSHVLDGLLRQKPCGLVSSRNHVQGSPYRGLSLFAEPYRVSPADSCPRDVERTRLRCDPRQRTRPRLQGLAPRVECGVDQSRLKLQPIRAPPGLLLLRVLSLRTVRTLSRPLRPRP